MIQTQQKVPVFEIAAWMIGISVLQEITSWSKLNEAQRWEVLIVARQRMLDRPRPIFQRNGQW
jgi:hypothetical protein